ncbi:DUF4255 domain-containing protein [Dongia sp.]|uniref:DUF4255 domain-containing protein n=1 Tax=Dongia sp. TaxID=1977262 RepID=UPI0037515E5F
MQSNAIQQVGEAFKERIRAALAAEPDAPIGDQIVVHLGPLDDDEAKNADAVLFLYRVATNAELRNSPHAVDPAHNGAPPVLHEGAVPLDLHFLLTGGGALKGGETEALWILGIAIQAMNEEPNLVAASLQGETVRVSLDPVTSEEMSRIWSLFPTVNYRTSVAYLASPVWIDPKTPRVQGPPVVEEPHRFWHKRTRAEA